MVSKLYELLLFAVFSAVNWLIIVRSLTARCFYRHKLITKKPRGVLLISDCPESNLNDLVKDYGIKVDGTNTLCYSVQLTNN